MRTYLTLIALAFLVYVVFSRSIPSSSNEDIVDDLAQEANYRNLAEDLLSARLRNVLDAQQPNEESEDDDDDSNKKRHVIAEDDDEEENDGDNGSKKVPPSSEDEDDLVDNFHVESVQAETTKSSIVANVESDSANEDLNWEIDRIKNGLTMRTRSIRMVRCR